MTKRQTARDRIEAGRQEILAAIAKIDDAINEADTSRQLLEAQLSGIDTALLALGPPLKRQRGNGAAKPRKVKPADPQLLGLGTNQ